MPRRADNTLMTRIETVRSDLRTLEQDLIAYGDTELASACKRARREFEPAAGVYSGAVNTMGVNHGAVRR